MMLFRIVIPIKAFAMGKSRLELEPASRRRLATAIAQDTIAAALAARVAGDVVVIGCDPQVKMLAETMGARSWSRPGLHGLNSALTAFLTELAPHGSRHPTAVLMGDLPALEPGELDDALGQATSLAPEILFEDLHGGGTTMLASRSGALNPRFGSNSARRHAGGGARRVGNDLVGLRCDVDTVESLRIANYLGLGIASRAVVESMPALRLSLAKNR